MKEKLLLLEKNITCEIDLYKELVCLYEKKQEILVNKKVEELVTVDSDVIRTFDSIKSLIDNRNKIFTEMFNSEFNMGILIKKAEEVDSLLAKKFINQKDEVNDLVKKISKLDAINLELTKFGMKIANKTMQIILDSVQIPTNEYDKQGKSTGQSQLELSSISEEV